MKRSHLVAALLAAFTLSIQPSAQADTFGGGTTNVGQGGIQIAAEIAAGGFKSTGYGVGVRHSF